jgi:hypothetical protein
LIKNFEEKTLTFDFTGIEPANSRKPFILAKVSPAENLSAVQWLWTCKLKSRDSYLLILSFMNTDLSIFGLEKDPLDFEEDFSDFSLLPDIELTVLRETCTMLAPAGIHFFSQFVHKRFQFISHIDDRRILQNVQAELKLSE